jgi:hypothetical protein
MYMCPQAYSVGQKRTLNVSAKKHYYYYYYREAP